MIRAFSIDDVRAAEEAVKRELEPGELMQRAALGLAEVARARSDEDDRVVVLAGSGDNGADALYAAAHLARLELNVVALLVGSRTHEEALAAATAEGVVPIEWRSGKVPAAAAEALVEADLVIDGIVGIGASPGLPEHLENRPDLFANDSYVIAVDLPSGVDPSGVVAADCLYADETVTFSLLKPCHLLPAGEAACGQLTVVDIGVPEPDSPVVVRYEASDATRLWPTPGAFDDKYSRGVLGVMTGSESYPGAAVLGVTAAVTTGVGMVRYIGPRRATDLVLGSVPEIVSGPGRVQAWLLGSGWDGHGGAPELVDGLLDDILPIVLDAGALDLLDEPRSAPTLLTPHAGELKRLAQRLGLEHTQGVPGARAVADALGAHVLLKGATTLIVPPSSTGGPLVSQTDGPAWLATAGSGDVLAGMIGALVASGLGVTEAGALGVLLHGRAAHLANPGGPVRALDVARCAGQAVAEFL
ncbi:NAD(P)H-hydrate epimerase [Yimella sp. RIT 621]|uniref:NAD(P)H-hydrate epimerase n=1 Tax=Yimella sp. RIT 621 TaxID=2510323 RepID=UPI00101BB83F|nr:NAD(P)H-hydrate epimerase [Yimella sp. RIT 621]RYG76805.1 NAD(P)H-hydrate epimerase [Yimella sp. RIT 621]